MGYPGMLHAGSSGYNSETENLTANHSNAMCWERFHVPRTLKNPAVGFIRSRNLYAPPQEAKYLGPTHLSLFPVAIINSSTLLFVCPIQFFISSSFHVHFITHFMFIACIYLKYCCLGVKSQLSINQSCKLHDFL